MRCLAKICLILSLLAALTTYAEDKTPKKRPKIAFITPSSKGNTYWPSVFRVIDTVAASLNFEFKHYDIGVSDRFMIEEEAKRILSSKDKPDALVVSVVIGNTKPILDLAEAKKVPVLLLGPLFPVELESVGRVPRAKYKYWIANLEQNEVEKGYLSAKHLFTKAIDFKMPRKNGKIQLLALGGKRWWIGSLQRDEGMLKALKEFPDIELMQSVPADWDTEAARDMAARLIKRFPDANLIWAASDQMAEGAVQALTAAKGKSDKNKFLVSGIDLSEIGLNNVQSGRTVGSASMSMFGMGEMMIYLYDYLQGHDFAAEVGVSIEPETLLATRETAKQYREFYDKVGRINFKNYSKTYNPDLKKYDFSIQNLFNAADSVK